LVDFGIEGGKVVQEALLLAEPKKPANATPTRTPSYIALPKIPPNETIPVKAMLLDGTRVMIQIQLVLLVGQSQTSIGVENLFAEGGE